MDDVQRSLLKAADGFGAIAQMFMRTAGVLPDGRELVDEEVGPEGITARFPDLEDDGWPGFELRLPDDAVFHMAVSSLLTRGGGWVSRRPVHEVVAIVRAGLEGLDVRERRRAGRTRTALVVESPAFSVSVFEIELGSGRRGPSALRHRRRMTMVQVHQKRSEQDVKRGMQARAAAFTASDT